MIKIGQIWRSNRIKYTAEVLEITPTHIRNKLIEVGGLASYYTGHVHNSSRANWEKNMHLLSTSSIV